MKFCPICKTRYDEDILRFCIKDGTPLVDEDKPNFTALPSESDFGEETIIRRKNPTPNPNSPPEPGAGYIPSPRIVIPTSEDPVREPARTKTTTSIRRPPPQKSNATKTVLLTVFGTILLLAGAGGVFWFLGNQNSGTANRNANYNANFNSININLDANLNVDNSLANFNYNLNANVNINGNANAINANLKTTPTPARTPTPIPSPTPNVNANVNVNGAVNINSNFNARPPVNTTPAASPSPSASPRPSPSAPPANRPVNAGILNGRAVNLPKPAYPPIAKQMRATGQVAVQVQVDESGNVISARAMSGNHLLRASAEAAARQSRFNPVRIDNQAVKVTGIVLYNFAN